MRFALFCHSLVSDWNHGNAHFLRGVVRALQQRGHKVAVYEPRDGWSRTNLIADQGTAPITAFHTQFPDLASTEYDLGTLDLDAVLDGIDVVLVHEWTDPTLIAALGERRRRGGRFLLLFHDSHHRSVSAPEQMEGLDLEDYDGVLAFGEIISRIYRERGWGRRVWTWHEAADDTVFRPLPAEERAGDLVWVGNWGDDERSAELQEYLLGPVAALGITARIYGVRYPADALAAVRRAGAEYCGYLPNARVPEVFASFGVTVHVPRSYYVTILPGVPTIRVFEALACGIPLVSAPWWDSEELFRPQDFLFARNGTEMRDLIRTVLADQDLAASLAASGLETIRARHTCGHRADELLAICSTLRGGNGAGRQDATTFAGHA